jgi:hypothetical protein
VVDISKRLGPKDWSNTMQSLLYAMYSSAGFLLGSLLGGWLA